MQFFNNIKKINRKILIIIILLIILILLIFCYQKFYPKKQISCTKEAKMCYDNSFVGRIPPDCEFEKCPEEKQGILIISPKKNEKIKSPLKIEGKAKGFWFFEGVFTAELYDKNNNLLGKTILNAKSDWTTEDFVPFEGELFFPLPQTSSGTLKFLSDNPSEILENQKIFEIPVLFEEINYTDVFLYYYNPEKDKDENGNVKCSEKGIVPIKRKIPISQTPIKETINLLLRGKENLTEEEIKEGIETDFPLEGLKLKDINLKNGVLTLVFEDPFNKTSGGSCKAKILWLQIEKTSKQFPGVKEVHFLPEDIFQP
ncbi:MAG TPA: Gmad2 immunoglobulin-like domain-containing protein [Candidatus Pacearchaeota archaeon]|nr:Gmad2 immunoglobulin-like domain-containing protein [Candidatus Pacearchaeota archaeon]